MTDTTTALTLTTDQVEDIREVLRGMVQHAAATINQIARSERYANEPVTGSVAVAVDHSQGILAHARRLADDAQLDLVDVDAEIDRVIGRRFQAQPDGLTARAIFDAVGNIPVEPRWEE